MYHAGKLLSPNLCKNAIMSTKSGKRLVKNVSLHEQWQEAIHGVEEELLMGEARDIKKEARRRGLTERVNALLRERKFDSKLIT